MPFPGNVYGALRIARAVKQAAPAPRVVLGGGYVNTELRELERPAGVRLLSTSSPSTTASGRCWRCSSTCAIRRPGPCSAPSCAQGGQVVLEPIVGACTTCTTRRPAPRPTRACRSASYVSLFEMLNPMHRLWSDGRWNKLTVAHGCYWKKCTFCDVSLDYIGRYEPGLGRGAGRPDRGAGARDRADRLSLRRRGGAAGRAAGAGPAADRSAAWPSPGGATSASRRASPPSCAELLARSGCVAVSGGLEVASDRLLDLMKKGVTVAQVARVAARLQRRRASWCTPT